MAVGLVTASANHNHSFGSPNMTRDVMRKRVSQTARPEMFIVAKGEIL